MSKSAVDLSVRASTPSEMPPYNPTDPESPADANKGSESLNISQLQVQPDEDFAAKRVPHKEKKVADAPLATGTLMPSQTRNDPSDLKPYCGSPEAKPVVDHPAIPADNTPKKARSDTKFLGGSPKAKDAADPSFLGEFFQNSRLHHISTMGANAKVRQKTTHHKLF